MAAGASGVALGFITLCVFQAFLARAGSSANMGASSGDIDAASMLQEEIGNR
jgi:hypothetical protein